MEKKGILMVVECVTRYDWSALFSHCSEEFEVEQGEWDDFSPVSYDTGLVVARRATTQPRARAALTFSPTMVLMRSESKGHWGQDSTAKLFALVHSGVPCINSADSITRFLHKPVLWQALKGIAKKVGPENFALVKQTLYPSFREMIITPELPFVLKIGSFDAGKGKAIVRSVEQFEDLKSIVAVQPAYSTAENYIKWDWDGRVQVIGPHIRVVKRTTEYWKGNLGRGAVIEDLEVTDQFRMWAEECRALFGGLELFGLDFLHDEVTGKLWILELNGTACGLVHRHEQEDLQHIADVTLAKWHAVLREQGKEKKFERVLEVDVLQEQVKRLIVQNLKLKEELEELKTKK